MSGSVSSIPVCVFLSLLICVAGCVYIVYVFVHLLGIHAEPRKWVDLGKGICSSLTNYWAI